MSPALRVVYEGQRHAQKTRHVGAHLKAIRMARGITQEQAAVRAGLTRNTLAKHESSALPNLKLSTMLALVELYQLTALDELVAPAPVEALLHSWQAAGRPGLRGEFLG